MLFSIWRSLGLSLVSGVFGVIRYYLQLVCPYNLSLDLRSFMLDLSLSLFWVRRFLWNGLKMWFASRCIVSNCLLRVRIYCLILILVSIADTVASLALFTLTSLGVCAAS